MTPCTTHLELAVQLQAITARLHNLPTDPIVRDEALADLRVDVLGFANEFLILGNFPRLNFDHQEESPIDYTDED
jgi:hypothetical protein